MLRDVSDAGCAFQNDLAEARRRAEREEMSDARRVCLFSIRVLVWLFVFGVWIGSFYVIVTVVGDWVPQVSVSCSVSGSVASTLSSRSSVTGCPR